MTAPPRVSSSQRLSFIEGLRGYLAFWVVICHVMEAVGLQPSTVQGLPRILIMGTYAVDVFVIVSGFVIFFALDTQRQGYAQFVVRRFFRLFPLFVILFAAAIPASLLSLSNAAHSSQYMSPGQLHEIVFAIQSWWQHFNANVLLHLTMLHGTVPDTVVFNAPGAFLVPAWSVSLEWQFYLLAPLAFAMAFSPRRWPCLALIVLCAALFIAAPTMLMPVDYGAFLPFHVQDFFLGGLCYAIYKHRPASIPPNVIAISSLLLGGALFAFHDRGWPIPIALWVVFFGLMLERSDTAGAIAGATVFANRFNLYLGRISYGVYLSHILIIIVLQAALLACAPGFSRAAHFVILLATTSAVTIAVSTLLHRWIEKPGIEWGRRLARRMQSPAGGESRWRMPGRR